MLMMMRSDDTYTPTEGCSAEELLKCLTADDYDACVAACSNEEEENTDPEEVKAGTLNVTMKSEEGGEFPNGVSSLPVVTYTLKAVDEDIDITSIVIEEGGYGTPVDAALFIDGQRVSKVKTLTTLNTEYTLNLTNAYTVKAGKSVDIEVRVSDRATAAQQFNISLKDVNSSAEKVNLPANVKSNTFKLITNTTIALKVLVPAGLDNPKAGTKGADLFEIKLDNTANNQDVEFNAITLVADDKDVAEDIENVKLLVDNEVVANGKLNKKNLTFVLNSPYVIEKNKSATFTVRADVVGGAGKTFQYTLEDAMDLSATAVAYNASVQVKNATPVVISSIAAPATSVPFSNFTISAGRVTIERTNPSSNTFSKNRKNLFLGSFTITDNNKSDLTLNGFDIDMGTNVSAYVDSVKVRYGSNTAGLIEGKCTTTTKTVCAFDDEKAIDGKLTVYVYADINATYVLTTENFTAQAKNFDITENENDESVTDLSLPNSWMQMNATASALNLTNVKLSNDEFAKGADGIEAVSFKVKTTSAEGVKMKKLVFTARLDDGNCSDATYDNNNAGCVAPDTWTAINANTIRNATLYVGDKTYPATINAGTIKVNDTIELAKDTTTTFTLKVDLTSNPSVKPSFQYALTSYEAEDTSADRNDLTPAVLPLAGYAGRIITIKQEGTLSITTKATATANKYVKSILAGTTADVMEYSLKASYEDLKVTNGTITVALTGLDANEGARIDDIQLVYGEDVVASDAAFDAGYTTATFTNVNFDITTTETPLIVRVVTKKMNATADYAAKAAKVDSITFTNVYGKVSGNKLTAGLTNTSDSKEFDVVPATVTASVKEQTASKAVLLFSVDKGDNTKTAGAAFDLSLDTLVLDVTANNKGLSSLTIKNGNGVTIYNTVNNAATCLGTDVKLIDKRDGTNALCLHKASLTDSDYDIEDGTEYTFTYMVGDANTPSFTVDLTNVVFDSTFTNAVDLSNRMATSLNLLTK